MVGERVQAWREQACAGGQAKPAAADASGQRGTPFSLECKVLFCRPLGTCKHELYQHGRKRCENSAHSRSRSSLMPQQLDTHQRTSGYNAAPEQQHNASSSRATHSRSRSFSLKP